MSGKLDKVKGRLKEAAGALLDDPELKHEGQRDQEIARVKETAAKRATEVSEEAAEVAKKTSAKVKKQVERMTDSAKKS